MASPSSLLLQLLITARDEASAVLGRLRDTATDALKTLAGFLAVGSFMQDGVQTAADFEQVLARIKAAGVQDATALQELAAAAQQMGVATGQGAQAAAEALEALVKSGLAARDAISALPAVMALAEGQGLKLDETAELLTNTLNQFGLTVDQTSRIADGFTTAANISSTTVDKLRQAIENTTPLARQAGLSFEQTAAAIDVMAKNGVSAGESGTALAALFGEISNAASPARAALRDMGITTGDLTTILAALNDGGGAAQAVMAAFSDTARRAAQIMSIGLPAWQGFTRQIRETTGSAKEGAEIMGNTYAGSLARLNAAWTELKRSMLEPVLQPVAAGFATLFTALRDTAGLLGGAVSAGLLLVGNGFAALLPKITAFIALIRTSVATVGVAQTALLGFNRVLAILGGPVGLLLAAVGGFLAFRKSAEATRPPLVALAASTTEYATALQKLKQAQIEAEGVRLAKEIQAQEKAVRDAADAASEYVTYLDYNTGASIQARRETVALTLARGQLADEEDKLATLRERQKVVQDVLLQREIQTQQTTTASAQTLGALTEAYRRANAEVQDSLRLVALAKPGSEQAIALKKALAEAQQRATEAQRRYNEAIDPAAKAQAAYAQAAASALETLQPYKAKVDELSATLRQQQTTLLDTTATQKALNTAQNLLREQTNAYYATLKRAEQGEQGRLSTMASLLDAYRQQERQVRLLTLSQDGNEKSAKALENAKIRLDQLAKDYTSAAQDETAALERQQKSMDAQAETSAQTTLAKLAEWEASKKLAEARGDETAAARAAFEIAQLEAQQARELATRKQQQAQAAQEFLAKKQQEYALTLQNNSTQQHEIALLTETVKQKQQEVAVAQASIAVKEREAQQAAIMAGPIGQLGRLYQQLAEEHQRAAAASADYYQTQLNEVQGSLKVAQVKGDEVEVARLLIQQTELQIDQAQALAQAKAQEAADAEQALAAKALELAADSELSQADQEQLTQLQATTDAKRAAAQQAFDQADALQAEADAAREATQAAEEQAKATAAAVERAAQLAAQSNLVSGALNGWIDRLQALSPAAAQAFKQAQGFATATQAGADASDNARMAADALSQTLTHMQGGGLVAWLNETAARAQTVEVRFWEQAAAAEHLTEQLMAMAEGGRISMYALQQAQTGVQDGFDLLDQTRLDNLQNAIEAATQKMEDLRQASLEALDAAQRALLQEQGDQAALARLDFERTQLELQQQINAARAAGDADAIANLQKALDLEQKAYDLKLKKLKAEEETNASSSATSTASTNATASGKTYTLNLTGGNKTLTATTETDPSAFLTALENARKTSLV